MVDITIADGKLRLHVEGLDELWSLKSTLEVPLRHINGVRADPEIARGWWHGLKMPGTSIPGVITAGTFYQDGKRVFWDVHHPENTIVLDLRNEKYQQLIIEVADPAAAIEQVSAALATQA